MEAKTGTVSCVYASLTKAVKQIDFELHKPGAFCIKFQSMLPLLNYIELHESQTHCPYAGCSAD